MTKGKHLAGVWERSDFLESLEFFQIVSPWQQKYPSLLC